MTCGACVEGNIFFHAHVVCFFHLVTALSKRLLPGAQHWIIQADEQTWAAPSNLAPRGTAEFQLELRGTPLPPVPLGRVVLQRVLWCHLLWSQNWTKEQEQRMCMWSLAPALERAAASDTALGHRVQVTFMSINGVLLQFDFYLQEGFGMAALLWAGGRAELTLRVFLNCFSWSMKQAPAGVNVLLLWAQKLRLKSGNNWAHCWEKSSSL